jgi:hypothetical protein
VKLTTVAGVNPIVFFGFVINNGTWNIDPAQTITQGDFNTGYGGVVTGNGQMIVGGNWVNQSTDKVDFNMKQMDLEFVDPATLNNPDPSQTTSASIYNPTPTYTGLNLSHLITPGVDVTNPGANPGAPVLYVGALDLIAGLGDNPSATRTLNVDGQEVTTPDETTLDVHGGTIYDTTPLVLPPDTEIIDSLDPGRSLSSMVQFVSSLPDDDYAVQSLILNGANYVVLELPEPSAPLLAGMIGAISLLRRSRSRRH